MSILVFLDLYHSYIPYLGKSFILINPMFNECGCKSVGYMLSMNNSLVGWFIKQRIVKNNSHNQLIQ